MSSSFRSCNRSIIMRFGPLLAAAALLVLLSPLSCGGPVGGYMVEFNLNGEKIAYPQARVYIEKIDLFEHGDGDITYSFVQEGMEHSHLLFTLVAGEWGEDPVFILKWIAETDSVPAIAGRNFAAFQMKTYPPGEKYQDVVPGKDYSASYNDQTCYVVITITNIEREDSWINGIFNGVYVEQVGDRWWRMEISEGRFGAGYGPPKGVKPTEESLPEKSPEES